MAILLTSLFLTRAPINHVASNPTRRACKGSFLGIKTANLSADASQSCAGTVSAAGSRALPQENLSSKDRYLKLSHAISAGHIHIRK
ncbi:hypothetical protein BC830DRAFT_940018 [Chytriomyces sp. MP71]|nr:hypothetical protein BC830DRAFT_940018 [Chytriomyces sp. MP71]